jgi:small subunit ribosomal protein S1
MVVEQSNRQSQKNADKKNPYSWMDSFDTGVEEISSTSKKSNGSADGSFAQMFEQSLTEHDVREGDVVDGVVVAVSPEFVTIDIGYKSEGLVNINEFKRPDGTLDVEPGMKVTVLLERMEGGNGFLQLSKDKAEIIKAWDEISRACENEQLVEGTIIGKVKGGLSVDIGVKAFLPGSQLDVKPVKNLEKFLGKRMKFKIIKFNKKRGNIVLSRRAVVQEEKERMRAETISGLEEGQVVTGGVKNITDYGAFIDLGGVDGLLHITDMSWGRIKHPSELFKVGDEVTVKVLKYDREKERISLGLKQVSANPWDEIAEKINIGDHVRGKVVSVKDYGAFVELAEGIEGLIHVSEMSWRRDVKHPSQVLKPDDEVECQVLEIDARNKRLSLGLKQLQENPWITLASKYPPGSKVQGEVKSVADFGVFVDIGEGIDGLIHVSDISWNKKVAHPSEKYNKGDKVEAIVLGIDKDGEKFSLGVKQLERDPWEEAKSKYKAGTHVEGKVTKITDFGVFVELEEGIEGLVYVAELSDTRVEKPSDIVRVGDVVRAEVTNFDGKERRISLSVRKLKHSEERANYESYIGKGDTKTSLGDVLGAKLKGSLKTEGSDQE